jgi:hypothetical protein
MARTQGTTARTQRLIAGIATACVAVACALALGRVFAGAGPTMRLLVAGIASAAIAAALERRSLVLATLASLAGLLVTAAWFVFPETTWFAIPTPETVRAIVEAAGLVGEQARVQIAPTPPLAPLMLAAVAGVWAAVFASHSLAFRAGSPLLGLLPPVALVGFADSVLEDLIRPLYGLLFLVAAIALLFADGLRRVQGWGPVWSGPGRRERLDVAAGRGARRVAVAAVAVAAVAPVVLPGFGSSGLIDFSTSDDSVRIDPLVSVASSLQRDEVAEVLEVQAEVGRYWRLVALPNFDGEVWSPDDDPPMSPVGTQGVSLQQVPAPLGGDETAAATFTTLSELELPWLPIAHPPVGLDAPLEGMRWEPEGGSIALDGPVGPGVTYTAEAAVVQPTPEELRADAITSGGQALRYTQVPDDFPSEIATVAERWTEEQETDYDRIIAIQQRFTDPDGHFSYDDEVPASSSDAAMLDFLQRGTGFCQQFSSTMAVMLRSLGIPARLAVGFTPGMHDDPTGTFTVTTENMHSWVEVLFPTYGWVPFEPTPNRQNLTAYPYLDPTSAEATCRRPNGQPCASGPGSQGGTGAQAGETAATSTGQREGPRIDLVNERPGPRGGPVVPSGIIDASPPSPYTARNGVLLAIVLGAVVLALVPPWRSWQRRRRLRRAGSDPRRLVLAAYDVFADRAGELGFPRGRGQTIEEYRREVARSGAIGDGDLDRLSRLTTQAAYTERSVDRDDADDAVRASHAVVREMRRHAGWTQRLTGPYRRR